ncbi:MAG: hypothetical protein AAF253_08540 [Pseudomonadota bacterium]
MALAAGGAHAAETANGTAAGTPVDNTFTLDYEVNNTPQTQITPANPTRFTVDRIVDLTLAVDPVGAQDVAADEQGVTFEYTITNDGNDIQAYSLHLEDIADDFDATIDSISYAITRGSAVDLDGSGTALDNCEGTSVTGTLETDFVTVGTAASGLDDDDPDDGAADITCPIYPDEEIVITVTFDIPAGLTVGDDDDFNLLAQSREPLFWINTGTANSGLVAPILGEPMDATPGTNDSAAVENVFLDSVNGPHADDDAADGNQSVANGFDIIAQFLTATKEAWVMDTELTGTETCDDNGTTGYPIAIGDTAPTDEFPIPGSCVAYVIEVVNSDADVVRDATSIDLSDQLPVEVQYSDHVMVDFDNDGTPTLTTCAGTDVAPAQCTVDIADAELDSGNTGALVIYATVR